MSFKFGVPTELVAQVTAGATGGGVAALLANPAFAPLWGALAALVLALVQAALRRIQGKAGDADSAALKGAAMVAAEAALDALLKAREAERAAQAAKAAQGTESGASGPSAPPGGPLALVLALVSLTTLGMGCNASMTPLDYARGTLNAVAAGVNAGGEQALDAYCAAQLRAANRRGRRMGGECRALDGVTRVATDAERDAVAQVRADWRPVLVAHNAVADAHELAVSLVRSSDTAVADRFVPALTDLTQSYGRLGTALVRFGVNIPPVFPVSGDAGVDGGTDAAPDVDASESE